MRHSVEMGPVASPRLSRLIESVRDWQARPWSEHSPLGSAATGVFTPWQRTLLLAAFALVVVLRLPRAWMQGRFQGEEGTIFFAYAWHRPAGEALWRSFAGYLNLGANASTLLAERLVRGDVVPLELAPYVTMGIALSFQLLPAVLLLIAEARWLSRRWAVIAALLIVAISPMTEEVFANVLHIQFHLALCTGLILALDVPGSRLRRVAWCVPLALAPLCGPGAILLLPLFVLRGLLEKSRGRLVQAAALGFGAALQLGVFFTSSPLRGELLDPATLANLLFVRLAAMPILSSHVANLYGRKVYAAYVQGGPVWWAMTLVSVAYFAALLAVAYRRGRDAALWLILSGLVLAAVVFGSAMLPMDDRQWFSVGAAERYNFLPLVLLGLGAVALAAEGPTLTRRVFGTLCVLQLGSGALTYSAPVRGVGDGPSWRDEVAAWRQDSDHPLRIWPDTWSVDLSHRSRPCTTVKTVPAAVSDASSAAPAAVSDPTYCESHWSERMVEENLLGPLAPGL